MISTVIFNTQTILDIIKYVGTFVVGGIAFLVQEKYTNRKAIFTKKIWGQQLAFSLQSQDWGNIQILYNDVQSNNLHILSAEITNSSDKDFAKLMFEFSVPERCTIYRHQGQLLYDDLTKDLTLQKEFNDTFEDVKTQHQATIQSQKQIDNVLQSRINFVTRHRRFDIPLIKGKTKAVFHFLVEDLDNNPFLNISILEPGIKVTTYQDEAERKESKKKWTEYGGLIIFLLFSFPVYKYSNSISMAILLMIINLILSSIISLGVYYFFQWIKKIY